MQGVGAHGQRVPVTAERGEGWERRIQGGNGIHGWEGRKVMVRARSARARGEGEVFGQRVPGEMLEVRKGGMQTARSFDWVARVTGTPNSEAEISVQYWANRSGYTGGGRRDEV